MREPYKKIVKYLIILSILCLIAYYIANFYLLGVVFNEVKHYKYPSNPSERVVNNNLMANSKVLAFTSDGSKIGPQYLNGVGINNEPNIIDILEKKPIIVYYLIIRRGPDPHYIGYVKKGDSYVRMEGAPSLYSGDYLVYLWPDGTYLSSGGAGSGYTSTQVLKDNFIHIINNKR